MTPQDVVPSPTATAIIVSATAFLAFILKTQNFRVALYSMFCTILQEGDARTADKADY